MIFNAAADKIIRNIINGITKVGKAKEAEKLNGQESSYYATADSVCDVINGTTPVARATDADTVGGNSAAALAKATDLANYLPIYGTAAKATADASGNDIADTYKTKAESANIVFTEDNTTAPEDITALWAHL